MKNTVLLYRQFPVTAREDIVLPAKIRCAFLWKKLSEENDRNGLVKALLEEYDGYAHFKPFKERNVYACNTHKNNLFEETAFHPERLLKELVALFHPSLLPEYKTVYYEKMR